MARKLVLCSCQGSQTLDPDTISAGCGLECSPVHSALCTSQIEAAARYMSDGDAVIACGQELAVFQDLAEEIGAPEPGFVDLRDRAGWSDEGAAAAPKMAALAAEAVLPSYQTPSLDVESAGTCLIVGPGDAVLPLAENLAGTLAVTVLLTDSADPPPSRVFDVTRGQLRKVSGALGGFEVTIDDFSQIEPGGRGGFQFGAPRDNARSSCDILIDLAGAMPFVSAPEKREGYLRADPGSPLAASGLAAKAIELVGTFEKPLYVSLAPELCAHSRAEKIGCSRCLDICPTGAISPDGDHVSIDPMICAGCGACAALCPSGAISADAPPLSHLLRRIEALATAFRSAGGNAPRLLVHDESYGVELIRLSARFGCGLPADVVPLSLPVVSGFGHAEMLAALASGFVSVTVLTGPRAEREALDREMCLAEAISGPNRFNIVSVEDPDALSAILYDVARAEHRTEPVLTMGNRRQVARLAARVLHGNDVVLPLPDGAPYGAVLVNRDACTLCLSCASLCPSGALLDNPDRPELKFQEDACLQCGLCANVCPENAISYEPRFNLADSALSQVVLNEEDPFACVECGALFGVKSTVERMVETLAGKHPMFASGPQARMIQMCDNCRVAVQFQRDDNPLASKPRRPVRTTDDYFSDRKDH